VVQGDVEEKLEARIATGEVVLPHMTVSVVNGVAYAADGSDPDRKANGVCVGASSKAGHIYWQSSGVVPVRVKRDTGVSDYGTLYQSSSKGWLTNNMDESGIVYVQPVGTFVQWMANPLGGQTSVALVSLMVSGSEGEDPPVTSVNSKTGDVVLELDDLADVNAPIPNQGDLLSYEAIDIDIGSWKPRSILDAVQFVNIGDLADVDDSDRFNGSFLQWVEGAGQYLAVSIANSGAFTPTYIASNSQFTVPTNTQVLFAEPIDVEGVLNVDGTLVEVD